MTWKTAKSNSHNNGHSIGGLAATARPDWRQVVFVVYPGAKLLDLSGPLQVFNDAVDPTTGHPAYAIAVASLEGGPVPTDTTLAVPTQRLDSFDGMAIDSLVVVGGRGVEAALAVPALLEAIARLQQGARRTASVCSGAFLLAEAGLLAGRRAVTHWDSCKKLAADYPEVTVENDPIFIKDGSIWTSAGVTAGIDLALAMLAEDLGRPTALAVARRLVAYMVRPGGQSQFSSLLDQQASDRESRFDDLHGWIAANLAGDLRVEALAARVNMSPRSFARRYRGHCGETPAKAVERLRLDAARAFLESSDLPVASIAQRCGFGDDERMRCAFRRQLRVAPNDYRQRFRT